MPMLKEDLNSILDVLFEGEARRLAKEFSEIRKANDQFLKVVNYGITHEGIVYSDPKYRHIPAGLRPSVAYHLTGRMDQYVKDLKTAESDRKFFKQIIHRITQNLYYTQEFRDVLPDCLVACSLRLQKLPRTKVPGYTMIEVDERSYRQLCDTTKKMEMYFAIRLMF